MGLFVAWMTRRAIASAANRIGGLFVEIRPGKGRENKDFVQAKRRGISRMAHDWPVALVPS